MKVYQATDVGKVRVTNEDSLAVFDRNIYVVADGMGGCAAGEVASQLLVEQVGRFLSEQGTIDEDVLRKAVEISNREILNKTRKNPEYQGMGTTATLFHSGEGYAIWAHVGDSRLYHWHQGQLHQVTRDHSYVESLVEQGMITEEEARRHPQKNILTNAVGVMDALEIDTGHLAVAPGDSLLLCTDGLTNMVSDEEIGRILEHESVDPAAMLVQKALLAGGQDNISVIVVRYDEK